MKCSTNSYLWEGKLWSKRLNNNNYRVLRVLSTVQGYLGTCWLCGGFTKGITRLCFLFGQNRQNSNALFANMLLLVSFNVVTSVFPSLPIALTQNIDLNVSVLGKWLKTQIWIMIMIVWFYLDLIKGWLTLYVDVHTPSTCSVMCFIWGNILLLNIMEFSVCKFVLFLMWRW